MRTKTGDRRVRRTRKQLHDALLSRILEKRYEAISVQEILDRADIGRSTFYEHFRGKDELLASGFEAFKASLLSAEADATRPELRSYEWIVAPSAAMFEHAAKYREVHRALHGSRAESLVHRNLRSVFFEVFGRRVADEMNRRRLREPRVSPEILTLFLVSTQLALLTWWIDSRSPLSVEEIDRQFRGLVLPALASVFELTAKGEGSYGAA